MLPKEHRLKNSSDFDLAYKKGVHLKGKYGQLIVFDRRDRQPSKVGIVISAKKGKASRRNLAKRRIREVMRAKMVQLGAGKILSYIPWDIKFSYADIKKELDHLCDEIPNNGPH